MNKKLNILFSISLLLTFVLALPARASTLLNTLDSTVNQLASPVTSTLAPVTDPLTSTQTSTLTSTTSTVTDTLNQTVNGVTNTLNQLNPDSGTSTAGTGKTLTDSLTGIVNGLTDPLQKLLSGLLQNGNLTVELAKISGSDTVAPGGMIEYRIVVSNAGNDPIPAGQLIDRLPQQIGFASTTGGTYDAVSRTVTWQLGELSAQSGMVIGLQTRVDASVPSGTSIENSVTLQVAGKSFTSLPSRVKVGATQHVPFIQGYQDATFRPGQLTTRAEMAAIVARIKGLTGYQRETSFHDVDRGCWAYSYIQAVVEAGIFKGYPDGNFYPDKPITRAEMTAVTLRMNGILPFKALNPGQMFTDVDPSHWANDIIQTAALLAYVSGYGDGRFEPDSGIKRVEAVVMMDRTLRRGPLVDGETTVDQHFTDVSRSYWGFGWIEEAAKQSHIGIHQEDGEHLVSYTQ